MRLDTTTKRSLCAAALLASCASATTVTFQNKCFFTVNLYDNKRTEDIAVGASTTRELGNGFSGMFRHGAGDQATLVEFANNGGRLWYDISVIPPGPGYCTSFEDCQRATNGKKGYNVAVAVNPETSARSGSCRALTCEGPQCPDAYIFPKDDSKTHDCDASKPMTVVFCPSGSGGSGGSPSTPAPAPAPAQSTRAPVQPTRAPKHTTKAPNKFEQAADYESGTVSPGSNDQSSPTTTTAAPAPAPASSGNSSMSFPGAKIKSSFTYRGAKAGNVQGSYNMVTNTKNCVKETVTLKSPVGPLSEEVSMVFRGPMNIYNIAVFDGSKGGDWTKVSEYNSANGETNNMVFMNNKNIDYNTGVKSPQGFASPDALKSVSSAQTFSGKLAEASNPSQKYSGPGVTTGAELNIMTSTKCSEGGAKCKGYYDDNGFHGWDGGKKMFVTKVMMPQGQSPNQPAIWMLNAQVLRSNQYGCNCRGSGAAGGCGELDIAEVIETNAKRDRVTTHYYFYDGSVAAGGDNFADRPFDTPTTYLTIIDDADQGTVKVVEIGEKDFDFSASSVAYSQIQAWINAADVNLLQ